MIYREWKQLIPLVQFIDDIDKSLNSIKLYIALCEMK